MSCYLIKVENGHKVARSITSEEEYKQLRGSNEQKANLRLARAGNDAAKRRLVQFNYSGHYPQGVVKGMKLPSTGFRIRYGRAGGFRQGCQAAAEGTGEVWTADAGEECKTGRSCGVQARNGQDHPGEPGTNCYDAGVRNGYFGSRY